MQSVFWVIFVGLIGGVAVAVQASFAGVFTQKVGLVGNGLLVFGGGFITALIITLLSGENPLKSLNTIPWYIYLAGPLGIVIISSIGITTHRIGLCATLTLIIAAQLVVGVVMDHYGILTIPRPVDLQRALGIVILFIGTWIVLR